MKKKIIGLVLLPFLYARWSLIFIIPIYFILRNNSGVDTEDLLIASLVCWWCYYLVRFITIGNSAAMERITKWLMRILKVEYKKLNEWHNPTIHSGSAWERDAIEIKGERHLFSTATMGGNIYTYRASFNRKILFTYLFN